MTVFTDFDTKITISDQNPPFLIKAELSAPRVAYSPLQVLRNVRHVKTAKTTISGQKPPFLSQKPPFLAKTSVSGKTVIFNHKRGWFFQKMPVFVKTSISRKNTKNPVSDHHLLPSEKSAGPWGCGGNFPHALAPRASYASNNHKPGLRRALRPY